MWSEKYVWIAKYMIEMDKLAEIQRDEDNRSLLVLMLNMYLA